MKKVISLILVVLMSAGLTACGTGSSDASSEENSSMETESSKELSFVLSDEQSGEASSEAVSAESSAEVSPYIDGKKLVVFGDSITAYGTWGRSAAEELNMYFFNGAMGGITSAQGIDLFQVYVAAKNPDFVTLLFGMNDLIMTSPNTPKVTPEQFGENLKTLVQMTLDCGAVPILLTSNPLNPDLFYSAQGQDKSWYSEVGSPLEWLDVYNDVTREVAAETGTNLIDMREACEDVSYTTLLVDGIHLAAKGNEIFEDTLASWFKENYKSDPDAAPVSEEDTYVYVDKESGPVSVVSFKNEDWYTVTSSEMIFKEMTEGIKLCNTTGQWPAAHCLPENPVSVSVADGYLYYDISTANVNTSIILFFDDATPSAYTEGQYLIINPYLGGSADSYTGDLLANQTLKGNVALSALGIPSGVIHDGSVLITGVKVFVAGTAYENVTIRQLAVGTGD